MRCLKMNGQKGAAIVLTAFLLPLIIGITGLAVDVGNLYIHKSSLQNATDAAVLAGGHAYADGNGNNTTAAQKAVDEYLKKNEQLTSAYNVKDLTYKKAKDGKSTRITLIGEETVQTHFLKVFGKKEQTITAKSTAQVSYIGDNTPHIFDYAMIGGYDGKIQPHQMGGMNDIKNSIVFHSCDIDIQGKVHTNGGIWLDDNHYISAENLDTAVNKDSELWANSRDNYWDHYKDGQDSKWENGKQYYYDDMDEATRKAHIRAGHEHDDKVSGNGPRGYTWYYYYRMKDTKNNDYVGSDIHASNIDISFSASNPMTSSLYSMVQGFKDMTLAAREAAHVYLDLDSNKSYQLNPSHTTSIYPGLTCGDFQSTYSNTSQSYKIWDNVYKIIIVNGDLSVNLPANQKPDNDSDHLILISLNGNISLQGSSPFYGYIYAPNGTVLIDGQQVATIYGSVVAKSIFLTTGGQKIQAVHKTFSDNTGNNGNKKGGTVAVSLVDDDEDE